MLLDEELRLALLDRADAIGVIALHQGQSVVHLHATDNTRMSTARHRISELLARVVCPPAGAADLLHLSHLVVQSRALGDVVLSAGTVYPLVHAGAAVHHLGRGGGAVGEEVDARLVALREEDIRVRIAAHDEAGRRGRSREREKEQPNGGATPVGTHAKAGGGRQAQRQRGAKK